MLVLTRRVGEEIVVGGNIRITVVSVKGNRVRIGVTAPESVRVDRKEVHDRRAEFGSELDETRNGYLYYEDQSAMVSTVDCCLHG